jgi:methionyl-tRNA formyltransferase
MRTSPSAVKQYAVAHGLPVFQPESLKSPEARAQIAATHADALVVAAYGLLLPQAVLEIARRGALNIHASLLPRWRGAAPIQRALLEGDAETGISIMQMDAGLDTGPVLSQHRLSIAPGDDFQSLHDKLAVLGARAIVEALASEARPVPQSQAGATYARKISKEDEEINWSASCVEIERKLRALRPAPGARTLLKGQPLKLWQARCSGREGTPGTVLEASDQGILIGCGAGSLHVSELQRAGGKRLSAADFLRGTPLNAGDHLGAAR